MELHLGSGDDNDAVKIIGSNATFAGAVGVGVAGGSNAKLEVVSTTGEVFRADAASGAFRIVANQTGVSTQGAFSHTGGDATFDAGGDGGDGGQHGEGGGQAGGGGDGGDKVDASTSGDAGSPNRGAGGQPGYSGYGIVFSSNSVQSNSTGDKTLPSGDGGVHVGSVI